MSLFRNRKTRVSDLIIGSLLIILLGLFIWSVVDNLYFDESISSSELWGLKNRINQEKAVKNYQPDKYAVLIRGDYEERFVADMSLAYQVLLENGFKPDHIYVLADVKKKKEAYFHPIDDIATKENLEIVKNHLSSIVDEEDLLVVCLVDHGNRAMIMNPVDPGKRLMASTFNLRGEDLNEVELELYLSKIQPKIGILLFEFCFSGGFAERLGKERYVAIACTRSKVEGYSRAGNSFVGNIFKALSWRRRGEVDIDINKDGKANLQEAVNYAKKQHFKKRQKPVVKSGIPLDKIFIDE